MTRSGNHTRMTPKVKSTPTKYSIRVQRIIRFCEALTIPGGKLVGQKVVLRDWEKDFINKVYGNVDEEEVLVTRTGLLSMARKNGKTALIAMLLLVHLCGPEAVANGEIYSVAFDREQASQVFKYAANMIYASPLLSNRLNVIESQKKILDPVSGSTFQALSRDSRSKHGKSASMIIFDELAQYGTDRRLYDVMMESQGAYEEPLSFIISTQAENDAALFSELVDYGKKVNAGDIEDPTFVSVIYETSIEHDLLDEKSWYDSNPALGDFKNIRTMRNAAKKALEIPGGESAFRNMQLNQRVSADPLFIPIEVWKKNGEKPDLSIFKTKESYAGIDLSGKNDLTSLTFAVEGEGGHWHIQSIFFTPKDNIRERSVRDRVPYDLWAKQGFIIAVPGKTIAYDFVAMEIARLHGEYKIKELRFDRWRIELLEKELNDIGVMCWISGRDDPNPEGLCLVPHGQGYKDFSPAVERVEDLLVEEKILHGNHPVLTMCAANVRIETDAAGGRKFDKKRSRGRIDGMVSLAMALNWTKEKEPEGGSLSELYSSEPVIYHW